jgi:hypothetical protein
MLTNTEQYRKNYIAFFNAYNQYVRTHGKPTAEQIKTILHQAQTKFHLLVRNGQIVPPSKPITRPQPPTARPQKQATAKPKSRSMKAFWMP